MSCCCVQATEQLSDNQKYAIRLIHMASLHEHISNVWREADIKSKTWFKNERYEEFLFSCLGQAITDFVLKEGACAENLIQYMIYV